MCSAMLSASFVVMVVAVAVVRLDKRAYQSFFCSPRLKVKRRAAEDTIQLSELPVTRPWADIQLMVKKSHENVFFAENYQKSEKRTLIVEVNMSYTTDKFH